MVFLVFVQRSDPRVDLVGLVRNAGRHFGVDLEILSEDASTVSLRLGGACFTIRPRAATDADRTRAQGAELRGRAAGMSALADRCETIWEIAADAGTPELALHQLCGVAASVALGPVLPPDDSTLYGVRGAMRRIDALQKA